MVSVTSHSVEETILLGEWLGRLLEPGSFIALTGELGAGKTQFVRGVATGLGIDSSVPITSPTFTLLNEYQGRIRLYHFDLYRLGGVDDAAELGFDEYFHGDEVCLVEWAERLGSDIPSERLDIIFDYLSDTERRIDFIPHGSNHEALLKKCFDRRLDSCY
ncbi:tRNA (adenosine(37)-N6)-threonylcarbamoyltransferase complex ATPase subunit type 1 TsaE [Geobacter grbiciae]|uniref:tRNA (adenosine(37)-N6)-threonylcarbamoyltransferase complex ATPase subunit type 1 TsaE n=1 Tax=Geobacter grbiciae TaxID=155042 RepID=UPI001C01AC1B|nr:tRNA (adenosine(37)-N6)-threonylcarbamoyltransferase complex ATPase subunit type 1 TsaE [Geobacter grbiciae]